MRSLFLCLLAFSAPLAAFQDDHGVSPEAGAYLDAALKAMEQRGPGQSGRHAAATGAKAVVSVSVAVSHSQATCKGAAQ